MPKEFQSYIYVLTNKYFVCTVSVKQSCQKTLESIFIVINGMFVANLTNFENSLLVLVSWLKATGLISGMSFYSFSHILILGKLTEASISD